MRNAYHVAANDDYYTRPRPSICSIVRPGPNIVLDLGCGSGSVGRSLLETGKAKEVVGVEIFTAAAQQASAHYSKVYTGDLETLALDYNHYFDYAICGDILEHLKDPYAVVRRIGGWLKENGRLVCSVPNVRNWRVLKRLVFSGDWAYEDSGIMDFTHLRFFTRKTCQEMLKAGGFEIESVEMLVSGPKKSALNFVTFGVLSGFLATQVLGVGKKAKQ
jgi:2-polyprenyl-3-methyl-5-hydroxy-6-metoxy-1,4-benzoquinol methylase